MSHSLISKVGCRGSVQAALGKGRKKIMKHPAAIIMCDTRCCTHSTLPLAYTNKR